MHETPFPPILAPTDQPPALDEPVQLTARRLAELRHAAEALRTVEHPRLEAQLRRVLLFADPTVSENEAAILRQQIAFNEQQIASLEELIAKAEVIGEGPAPDTVQLGHPVTVRFDDGTEETLTIVSLLEADPSRGFVSSESPVGKALIGRAPKHAVNLEVDGQTTSLQIEQIGSPTASAVTKA